MKLSRFAVAAATSTALAVSTLTAPAAFAAEDDAPQGGSAMWLYSTIMTGALEIAKSSHAPNTHPTENFGTDLLIVAPVAIALIPLQIVAEQEVRLSSQFSL